MLNKLKWENYKTIHYVVQAAIINVRNPDIKHSSLPVT